MNLPRPPANLDKDTQRFLTELLKEISDADRLNRKTNGDVEAASGQRLIILSSGGVRIQITSDDAGTLTGTPLT